METTNNIDYIQTVKEQWDNIQDKNVIGYKINGNTYISTEYAGNTTYQDVLLWLEDNTAEPMYTDDEIQVMEDKQAIWDAKHIGEEYKDTGYVISFTSDDAVGLMQVNSAFQLGITDTNIVFSNGTIMPINADDFQEFAIWFTEKRNAFFV